MLRCPENAKDKQTNQQTNKQKKEQGSESKHWPLLNIAALLRMLSLFSSRTGGAFWSAEYLSRLAEHMLPRRLGNVAMSNTLWNWRKGHSMPPLILPSHCSLAFVRVPWIKDVIRLRRIPCGRSSSERSTKMSHTSSNSHLMTYSRFIDILINIYIINYYYIFFYWYRDFRDIFWTIQSVLNPFDAIDFFGYTVSDKTVQVYSRFCHVASRAGVTHRVFV